jgi:hypothetical protein
VSAFLKNAEEIFAVAQHAGPDGGEFAILVNRDGGIHMLEMAGWELEPLRQQYGAQAAYRVTRTCGQVRLEARTSTESCMFKGDKPARCLSYSIPDFPQYRML